jgi:hypothetical protein
VWPNEKESARKIPLEAAKRSRFLTLPPVHQLYRSGHWPNNAIGIHCESDMHGFSLLEFRIRSVYLHVKAKLLIWYDDDRPYDT